MWAWAMTMQAHDSSFANGDLLVRLTAKERAVLDLVVERHTTKEIARRLDLAPNTIDMRLRSARGKLGACDRNDVARRYAALVETCGKTTCGPMVMSQMSPPPLAAPSEASNSQFRFQDAASFTLAAPWQTVATPKLPEVLDERFGKAWRVAAIPLGALSIALLALALVAIAETLGMLI